MSKSRPATPIGKKILEIAERERQVEPDMYVDANVDYGDAEYRKAHPAIPQSRIREFFVQGVQGSWGTQWDKFKKAGTLEANGNWCAAFTSFCYRQAHTALKLPLPIPLCAGVTEFLHAMAKKKDLLVDGAEVFSAKDHKLLDDVKRMPRPGDIILFSKHVCMLREIDDDGNLLTIEGNTWAHTDKVRPKRKVWGIHLKKYTRQHDASHFEGMHFILGAGAP